MTGITHLRACARRTIFFQMRLRKKTRRVTHKYREMWKRLKLFEAAARVARQKLELRLDARNNGIGNFKAFEDGLIFACCVGSRYGLPRGIVRIANLSIMLKINSATFVLFVSYTTSSILPLFSCGLQINPHTKGVKIIVCFARRTFGVGVNMATY